MAGLIGRRILKSFVLKEFEALDDDGGFRGILSTYGNEDLVGDVCDEGCWDESVRAKGGHFPLLWQHEAREPIGSFRVTDTRVALSVEGHFNQGVQRGREAFSLLKAGDVHGLSVGFNMIDWAYVDGVRHITKGDLWEGSFVTFPANPMAYAEAKELSGVNRGTIRKAVSSLPEIRSLSEEAQCRILSAIDEALAEEAVEQVDEEDPENDPVPEKDPDDMTDDEQEAKSVVLELMKLNKSATAFGMEVKKVME